MVLLPEHVTRLAEAGFADVIVAQLEPGDCHEDEAAQMLAGGAGP